MLLLFACLAVYAAIQPPDDTFLVKPYLQLGDAPKLASQESLEVIWHAADKDARFSVEFRPALAKEWKKAQIRLARRVAVDGIAPHRVYAARLAPLAPGKEYAYRVLVDAKPVFEAAARARKSARDPYRFVVTGDCAAGTSDQKAIAYQMFLARPDFAAVAGDIVYSRGRVSEYREKFFPVYNADEAKPDTGAPLIRSTLFLAAPGNHDVGGADLGVNPDGLAYFLYWFQPLNGPLGLAADAGTPELKGPREAVNAFLETAGVQYPRMANFSFDYGNSHWTVIDSNKYADWTLPQLAGWLKQDLASARSAKWRFVLYHHPGLHSSKAHAGDQWMRLLSPVFEEGKVDIVFSGHVHNYERSVPMRFAPNPPADGKPAWRERVDGTWTLDRTFDGAVKTRASGVIYIVTGAGGARLYDPDQQERPDSWQPFTTRFVSRVHSLTLVDADETKLAVRQVDQEGREVDRFLITR